MTTLRMAALGTALLLGLSSTGAFAASTATVNTIGQKIQVQLSQFGKNDHARIDAQGHRISTTVMQLGNGGNVGVFAAGHDIDANVFTGICPPGTHRQNVALTQSNSMNVVVVPCN